ncbi:hypothetical protein FJTKL_01961 [Diaporthe vaccinii]|uniref:Condensation domain-containing protein n=1 Tax=Diaporthe vaccinii TaxID=105482 RepID=A0ABR4DZG0_9PEZI
MLLLLLAAAIYEYHLNNVAVALPNLLTDTVSSTQAELARSLPFRFGANTDIGISDTNRSSSIQNTDTTGFFANLQPARMGSIGAADPGRAFANDLTAARDRVREAKQYARVPYGVALERLGLASTHAREMQHAPLFQAVFDYRQGAAETGTIVGASFTKIRASRERTPHDVVLEMSDNPARDPLLTVKLQTSLYGPEDPRAFLDAYVSVLTEVSTNTALRVDEGRLGI